MASTDKRILITGATSGIGRALAEEFAGRGFIVGITGRRTHLLDEIKGAYPEGRVHAATLDVTDQKASVAGLEALIDQMGGLDILVANAGVANTNREFDWLVENTTISTNVNGFTLSLSVAYNHFKKHGVSGQIVGMSSVAALTAYGRSVAYCASKAFVSNYLRGMRHKAKLDELNVAFTDIKPGFIETPMIEGKKGLFWVISAEKSAKLMANAILARRNHAFIPARWFWVGLLLRLIPDWLIRTA